MKNFAKEFPDFPFVQVPLAQIYIYNLTPPYKMENTDELLSISEK